jgi:hypothetical protein
MASAHPPSHDPLPGMLDYLRRALRAFHRNPAMAALMRQMMTSAVPEARATIDEMNRTNTELFNRLLEGVAPERIPNVSFGINAALANAVSAMLVGALSLDEAISRVEWVARILIDGDPARPAN